MLQLRRASLPNVKPQQRVKSILKIDLTGIRPKRAFASDNSESKSADSNILPITDPENRRQIRYIRDLVDYFDPRIADNTPQELKVRGINKLQYDMVLRRRRSDTDLYFKQDRQLCSCPLCNKICEGVTLLQEHLETHRKKAI